MALAMGAYAEKLLLRREAQRSALDPFRRSCDWRLWIAGGPRDGKACGIDQTVGSSAYRITA